MTGEDKGYAIGIDLGATNSCVAVWRHGRVHIIPNEQGFKTTPSCVAFTDTDELVGFAAKNQIAINPTNTIYGCKRLIGRKFTDENVQGDVKLLPFKIMSDYLVEDKPLIGVKYEKNFSPEDITAMILTKMKEIAEAYLEATVQNAVISVPAYFNHFQRQATKEAGIKAGLNVMRLINEPTAAALAYSHERKNFMKGELNLLFFDLGAGTLDVSFLTIKDGTCFEVKAVAGDTHLGGEDFDNILVEYCLKEFMKKNKKDVRGNPRALVKLKIECENAKRILSSANRTSIKVDSLYNGVDFEMPITRVKFECLCKDIFKKCKVTVEKCLRDAGVAKDVVEEVVLSGCASRIPKIQQMLRDLFNGKNICRSIINPDQVVAYGAAVQAANLIGDGDEMVRNLHLSDVTPLSLGVGILGGAMCVFIPSNTAMPFSKEMIHVTGVDNQVDATINVYHGDRRRASKNTLLGQITIPDIPPGPRGEEEVKTCFDVDASGILNVTAEVISTGKKYNTMIYDTSFPTRRVRRCWMLSLVIGFFRMIIDTFTMVLIQRNNKKPRLISGGGRTC